MHISMRVLTALLLSDDRPGHYHLSDGVVAAARRLGPVRVVRMRVQRRCSGRLLALLTNAGVPADWLLRLAYGLSPSQVPPADFIVSAGAETLGASIAIARLTGAPNIFCGTLRRYHHDGLRLVLTSYASHASRPRHVMVLKPSALTRDALGGTRNRPATGAVPCAMGLLLGGESGECRFSAEDWAALLNLVERSYETLGIRWVVSNSRRTPRVLSDTIAARVAAGSDAIAAFVDVRVSGPGTLGAVLERVQAVVCTDDSSTMISECISAGVAVIGAQPRRAQLTPDEQGYRRYLSGNGWYRAIQISALTPDTLLSEIAHVQPLTMDPLDRLAGIIRERIPELFSVSVPSAGIVAHQPSRAAVLPSRRQTSTFSPGRTAPNTPTSSSASAQMFDGDHKRISPALEIGVRAKGTPITSRSGE